MYKLNKQVLCIYPELAIIYPNENKIEYDV